MDVIIFLYSEPNLYVTVPVAALNEVKTLQQFFSGLNKNIQD